jgi:hypothetical protein
MTLTAILLASILSALMAFMLGALLLDTFSAIRGRGALRGSPRGARRRRAPVPVRSRQTRVSNQRITIQGRTQTGLAPWR